MSIGKHTDALLGMDLIQVAMGGTSIFLNSLLLISNYKRNNTRWAIDGILISITALLDCIVGLFLVCGTLLRISNPSIVYDNSPWCIVSFIASRILTIACLDLVAILSLVRYLVINRNHSQRPKLWISISILVLLSLSTIAVFRILTEKLSVFPSRMYCTPIPSPKTTILARLTEGLCLLPLVIIPLCYISITASYIRRAYITYGGEFPVNSRPVRRILGVMLIILAYYAATVPKYVIVGTFRIYNQLPSPLVDAISTIAFTSIPLINAIFPLMFHEEINAAYCSLLSYRPSSPHSISLYSTQSSIPNIPSF
ncbi:hypothetical protein DSO57_1016594 [Entomophthora muscae]|uniref:Uncharacterized protein n=1 Tax=Entomophthora muscae TaxID=34485 RepID=A0ACC2TRZ9_9FUNG|nr:hypothetical protein DSO57_1016594 [Entomophthora muscae]